MEGEKEREKEKYEYMNMQVKSIVNQIAMGIKPNSLPKHRLYVTQTIPT